jgi:hypothetical protein
MYMDRPRVGHMSTKWREKTEKFLDMAFELDSRPNGTLCPYIKCCNVVR